MFPVYGNVHNLGKIWGRYVSNNPYCGGYWDNGGAHDVLRLWWIFSVKMIGKPQGFKTGIIKQTLVRWQMHESWLVSVDEMMKANWCKVI